MRVFIGYDKEETVAANVCAWSIIEKSSRPVSITMLKLSQLPLTRQREKLQSTDFAFSRFLVPYLCNYEGHAVFMDCDMLVRDDISRLFDQAQDGYKVKVVKHSYNPRGSTKFLGNQQTVYHKKNWSSVMLFNCSRCRNLTVDLVDNASGLYLHQFQWMEDKDIGELNGDWNHLVGEYDPNPQAKIAHFTLGTPCFAKYADCEFAQEWRDCQSRMLSYQKLGEYSKPERQAA